jgi:hypothetical protein
MSEFTDEDKENLEFAISKQVTACTTTIISATRFSSKKKIAKQRRDMWEQLLEKVRKK